MPTYEERIRGMGNAAQPKLEAPQSITKMGEAAPVPEEEMTEWEKTYQPYSYGTYQYSGDERQLPTGGGTVYFVDDIIKRGDQDRTSLTPGEAYLYDKYKGTNQRYYGMAGGMGGSGGGARYDDVAAARKIDQTYYEQARQSGIERASRIPDAEPLKAERLAGRERVMQMQPQQIAAPDYTANEELFRQQQELAAQLRARATGETLSPAEMQLQRAMARNVAYQQALAASAAPGASRDLAERTAAWQSANLGAQAATEAAQLRAQEQQQAEVALANLLGQQQTQRLATQELLQRGDIQNMLEANDMAGLREMLLRDYTRQGMDFATAEQTANLNAEQLRLAWYQAKNARRDARRRELLGLFGNLLGTAGGAMLGGPVGALAGGQIGGRAAGAAAPTSYSPGLPGRPAGGGFTGVV